MMPTGPAVFLETPDMRALAIIVLTVVLALSAVVFLVCWRWIPGGNMQRADYPTYGATFEGGIEPGNQAVYNVLRLDLEQQQEDNGCSASIEVGPVGRFELGGLPAARRELSIGGGSARMGRHTRRSRDAGCG